MPKLNDLNNPTQTKAILHTNQGYIIADPESQAFQEWPGSWELWQKMDNDHILRVGRWLKKCVIFTVQEKDKIYNSLMERV